MRGRLGLVVAFLVTLSIAAAASPPDSYVLRDADITYMLGKGMPANELKTLQARFGNHFLWARRSGTRYVIRDQRTLRQALEVLQRNVSSSPDRDARMGEVVDHAVKEGIAQRLP